MSTTRPLPAGCALLPTEPLRVLLMQAPRAVSRRRMVCVSGEAGSGKSVALDVLTHHLNGSGQSRVVNVELLHSVTDKQVIAALYEAATGSRLNARTSAGEISVQLRHALAGERIVLMIDEAQHASTRALEVVRQVHEHPTSNAGLILAGVGLLERLQKVPTLDSRVALRVRFTPMSDDDLVRQVRALHPLLAALSEEDIFQINDTFAGGSLRRWTEILEWLLDLTPAGQPPTRRHIAMALATATGERW